ncbi:hypothetical protein H0H87_007336, partial [Tephrocybe sp. NHM501043]
VKIRDFDDPNSHVMKTWEARLESNFTLDTTKIDYIKPDDIFLVRLLVFRPAIRLIHSSGTGNELRWHDEFSN